MDAIYLAEEVITSYSLRSYRAAHRRGVVCGCRACVGEMKRWVDWAGEDPNDIVELLADMVNDYSFRPTPARDA
jgi:hypothetical protein